MLESFRVKNVIDDMIDHTLQANKKQVNVESFASINVSRWLGQFRRESASFGEKAFIEPNTKMRSHSSVSFFCLVY